MHLLVIEGLRDIKITLELLIKFLLSGDMKYLYDQKSSFIMWKIYSYWKSMVFSGYSKFYHHNIEINAKIKRKMINLPSFNC